MTCIWIFFRWIKKTEKRIYCYCCTFSILLVIVIFISTHLSLLREEKVWFTQFQWIWLFLYFLMKSSSASLYPICIPCFLLYLFLCCGASLVLFFGGFFGGELAACGGGLVWFDVVVALSVVKTAHLLPRKNKILLGTWNPIHAIPHGACCCSASWCPKISHK